MLCHITSVMRLTSIAQVAIIYATVPFLTAAPSWAMLRPRPSRDALAASIAALGGARFMVGLGHKRTLTGDALALGLTLATALLMVITRKHPQIPTLPAGITATILSILLRLRFAAPGLPAPGRLLRMAGFGLVSASIGFALVLGGSSKIPPIKTALLGAVEASLAPIRVWLIFAETPSLPTLLSAAGVPGAVTSPIVRQYRR